MVLDQSPLPPGAVANETRSRAGVAGRAAARPTRKHAAIPHIGATVTHAITPTPSRPSCGVSCQLRRKHEDRMGHTPALAVDGHHACPTGPDASMKPSRQYTVPGLDNAQYPNIDVTADLLNPSQLGLGRSGRPIESGTRRLISARLAGGRTGGRPSPLTLLPRRCDNAEGAQRELAGGMSAVQTALTLPSGPTRLGRLQAVPTTSRPARAPGADASWKP